MSGWPKLSGAANRKAEKKRLRRKVLLKTPLLESYIINSNSEQCKKPKDKDEVAILKCNDSVKAENLEMQE